MHLALRALKLAALLTALTVIGTVGFHLIEGWSLFDSLYMAIITLTTVGYGEVHPLSGPGRVFVMFYLVVSLGFFLYGIVQVAELMLRAQLLDWFGRRKMDSQIKSMKDHFIICGYGRMGQSVCLQLAQRGIPFLAIDRNREALAECKAKSWHWLAGDATDDDTLIEAGITRARGIASVLESDADNLFVVMSARMLNPKLQIISRASEEKQIPKLQRAGANRVVSMFTAAGAKMAQLLINPQVDDFFEVISERGDDLSLAEVHVPPESPLIGKALRETDFRARGIMVVGIRRNDGRILMPPESAELIQTNDHLIMLARSGVMEALRT